MRELLAKYKDVFAGDLGTMRHFQARVEVEKDAKTKFHRARPVPYALQAAAEEELDLLEQSSIIEKITHSIWAAPIVTVPKKDGSVRTCGDCKVTVNPIYRETSTHFFEPRTFLRCWQCQSRERNANLCVIVLSIWATR